MVLLNNLEQKPLVSLSITKQYIFKQRHCLLSNVFKTPQLINALICLLVFSTLEHFFYCLMVKRCNAHDLPVTPNNLNNDKSGLVG